MLVHFLELGAFGCQRDAVALQVDVDALRAVGGALARGLAAMAERPSALDAGVGEPVLAPHAPDHDGQDGRQHRGDGQRIEGADHWLEVRVRSEERLLTGAPGDAIRVAPDLGQGRVVDDDLLRRRIRGQRLDVGAFDLLGLLELLSLLVELVGLSAGHGVVVEGDGQPRILLLGLFVLGDGRGKVVVDEVQVAEVHVRAGGVVDLCGAHVVDLRLLLVAFLQLKISEQQLDDGIVGNEHSQLVEPAKRFRLITLPLRRQRRDHDRVLECGHPGGDGVDGDGKRRHDECQHQDEQSFHLAGVAEEDHEPVEDDPHGAEPEEDWKEEQRECEHGHGAAVNALAENLAEVVRHGTAVTDEERHREDCRREPQRHGHGQQQVETAQLHRAVVVQQAREAADDPGQRARPVLLVPRPVGVAERHGRRFRVELIGRLRRPVGELFALLVIRLPCQPGRRTCVDRERVDAVAAPCGDQVVGLGGRPVDVPDVRRRGGLRPHLARRRIVRPRCGGDCGDHRGKKDQADLHDTFFVRCT